MWRCVVASIEELQEGLRAFARERNWEQFHHPKNLLLALTGEVGELSPLLQWVSPEDFSAWRAAPENAERLRHELADCLAYLLYLADSLNIGLTDALEEKLRLNAERYPVDSCRVWALKYNHLEH